MITSEAGTVGKRYEGTLGGALGGERRVCTYKNHQVVHLKICANYSRKITSLRENNEISAYYQNS